MGSLCLSRPDCVGPCCCFCFRRSRPVSLSPPLLRVAARFFVLAFDSNPTSSGRGISSASWRRFAAAQFSWRPFANSTSFCSPPSPPRTAPLERGASKVRTRVALPKKDLPERSVRHSRLRFGGPIAARLPGSGPTRTGLLSNFVHQTKFCGSMKVMLASAEGVQGRAARCTRARDAATSSGQERTRTIHLPKCRPSPPC